MLKKNRQKKLVVLVRVCVYACSCVCLCMCVYIYICVFISFRCKGFRLNKMFSEFFCGKYLCHHDIDNHSRNLEAGNCAKECQSNRAKPREGKDNSY